ncbi:hypothetical protein Bca4012_082752 [Brassica carinata]
MSIVLRHRFFVRDLFAIPFHTRHGIACHYISRYSVLHVHQKVPIAGLKPSRKTRFKPSKPLQSKPDPVHKKPVQALSTIKTVLPLNQEQELLDGSITVGAAAPSKTKPDEKPFQAPSTTIKTARSQKPEKERFASSVTMGAAPSPRHVPVPMFCLREKIN